MSRLTRKLVSLLGIAAVLFAQLAIPAHACVMPFNLDDAALTSAECSSGSESASPALCQKHCENGPQNVNDTPQAPASVSLEFPFIVSLAIDPAARLDATSLMPSLQRTTSPPLAIRHCCFRI